MIIEFSGTGAFHRDTNGENQDALFHAQNKEYCVISLADGVSTCKRAKTGAEIASRAITNLFFKKGPYFLEAEKKQISEFAVSHILYELKQQAEIDFSSVEDYSSTITSVLVDKVNKRILCFNIGDGIIIASRKGQCRILAMPSDSSRGCCVTTTKNVASMASVDMYDTSSIESIVICSDGAWKKMFDKNRLKPEIEKVLVNSEFDSLKSFLTEQKCYDDYSFISFRMQQKNTRRTSA